MAEPHDSINHKLHEDAIAFVIGTASAALGVHFLTETGLVTGQTAGLAVLLSYLGDWSFGLVFFLLNLPFAALSLVRMGLRFSVKSLIAVAMVSGWSWILPETLVISAMAPWMASLLAGIVIGLGLVVLFRHGASLGGIGVLALYLQERAGVQAGWVQLGFDAVLFAAAFFVLDAPQVALSLAGAALVNVIVGVNHRQDRYIAR